MWCTTNPPNAYTGVEKEERRGGSEAEAHGEGGEQTVFGDGEKTRTGAIPLHREGKRVAML